jgi:hypothetical protein
MAKIYLVTDGDYSDYSVYGAFSTRERAQEYITARTAVYESFSYASIEEKEIDEGLGECRHTRWCVGMFLDDGAVGEGPHAREAFEQPVNEIDGIKAVPCYDRRPMVRVQSPESAEHALKLAAEARQKWLRGHLKCR